MSDDSWRWMLRTGQSLPAPALIPRYIWDDVREAFLSSIHISLTSPKTRAILPIPMIRDLRPNLEPVLQPLTLGSRSVHRVALARLRATR